MQHFLLILVLPLLVAEYMISDRNIERLPSDIPQNVTSVTLSETSITEISTKAFSHCHRLELVWLANGILERIEEHAFAGTIIGRLRLYNNRLTEIPDLSDISASLTYLDLEANRINSSLTPLLNLTSLTHLGLSNNPLHSVDPDFYSLFLHLTQLEFLNLASCGLSSFLDDGPVNKTSDVLLELDLSRNPLSQVPPIQSLHLIVLGLSHTDIILQPGDLQNLPFLKELYFENNKISSLSVFSELSQTLETLDLSYSDLSHFPPIELFYLIRSLPHLRYVHFDNCQLTTFPDIRQLNVSDDTLILDDNPFHCDCRLSWVALGGRRKIRWREHPEWGLPDHLRRRHIAELSISDLCPGKPFIYSTVSIIS